MLGAGETRRELAITATEPRLTLIKSESINAQCLDASTLSIHRAYKNTAYNNPQDSKLIATTQAIIEYNLYKSMVRPHLELSLIHI